MGASTPRQGRLVTRRLFVSYLGAATAAALAPALSGCSMADAIADTFGGSAPEAPGQEPVQPEVAESSPFPTARIAVLSDTHVAADFDAAMQHLPAAFQAIMRFDPAPDAIVLNGDIVNHGYEWEYDLVEQLAAEAGFAFPADFLPAMGDHEQWGPIADGAEPDYPGQRAIFLRRCQLDGLYYDTTVNGEHVIVLGPDEDPSAWDRMRMSEAQLEWLDQLLAADAANGARSFVVLHEPADDTVPFTFEGEQKHGSNESSAAFRQVVDKYPLAAVITGHTHAPAAWNRPHPDGPLYVCDGAVAYLRDGAFENDISEEGAAQSRGLLVDVYPDRTVFQAWDFVLDSPLDSLADSR